MAAAAATAATRAASVAEAGPSLSGFSTVDVKGDGNCFYRAVSLGLHNSEEKHADLRKAAMDHLMKETQTYSALFESAAKFRRCVAANRRSGVWNTEISDIAPAALAAALNICIIVHNLNIYSHSIDPDVVFGAGEITVHVLRVGDCHYNFLKEAVVSTEEVAEVASEED